MRESEILARVRLALGRVAKLFRNNVGGYRDEGGRLIRYGLCEGSSDLIGYYPYIITHDDIGRRIAIFTAIEVKAQSGKPTQAQLDFIGAVRRDGGIAGIVRSEQQATNLINNWKAHE